MLMYGDKNSDVPESLVLAQELQKARDYHNSRHLYKQFFDNNPKHHLRFKALFEVADNWFHEKKYTNAGAAFVKFIEYCDNQQSLTEKEKEWIKYYKRLALSRIEAIKKA